MNITDSQYRENEQRCLIGIKGVIKSREFEQKVREKEETVGYEK